jgi:hypothetical protein
VIHELESLFVSDEVEQKKLEISDIPFLYKPKKSIETPLVSFDGGLSTLFKGTPMEVSLIKVSGAAPPDHEQFFSNTQIPDILFHVFTGRLSSKEDPAFLKKELTRLCQNEYFLSLLAILKVDFKTFNEEMQKLVDKWKEKSTLRDSFRELLEWALIFDFIVKTNLPESGLKDYLVIKDGSLTTNARAITGALANSIKTVIDSPDNVTIKFPVIGVVKNSRFVGETPIGRIVKSYASMLDSHVFFQLPKKYEAVEDKDHAGNSFSRYFLTLFGGNSIYEIQIPNHICKDQEKVDSILDLIADNVTFAYGGSVSINSFAHVKASLSEAEGSLLEKNIYFEIKNKTNKGKK